MIKRLLVFIALITLSGAAAALENKNCYATFYQTKDMECVDTLLDTLKGSADNWAKQPQTVPYAAIGFLAEVFRTYPKEREHILAQDASDPFKSLYLLALLRAGLMEDARAYAQKKGWEGKDKELLNGKLPTLEQVKPQSNPADNDLLIGAYQASGNRDYISAILDNYIGTQDSVASDAFRIALMEGKFGPRLMAPGRKNIMAPALCKKYKCKTDINDVLHVMTLASALWATQSLARHDEGIKKTLEDFFDEHRHLKQLLAIEQNAFGNYITTLAAYAGIKDNPSINSSLSIYEKFGSGQDALNAMQKKNTGAP